MRAIMRVFTQYGSSIASAMATAASIARSVDELYQHAVNIANQWQGACATVEYGHQPANPQPQFAYFCWEWDTPAIPGLW
jgi:hypothetical protein